MAYTKQTWVDGSGGGTPINAARLGYIEQGISDAHALIPGGSNPVPGVQLVDSFAGANDAAKMAAALSYAAAQSNIPWLQLPYRSFDTGSSTFNLFTGCKIMGAGLNEGPKNLEISSGKPVVAQWKTSCGNGASSLLQSTSTMYDICLAGIAFYGGSSSQILRSTSNMYACELNNLTMYGCKHACGNPSEPFIITQVGFTGVWQVLSFQDTQFTLSGSDCALWPDQWLNLNTPPSVAGSGRPGIILQSMGKTKIGFMYITAENDWVGVRVTGTAERSLSLFGGVYEGRSPTNVATRPVLDVQGGSVQMFGPHVGQVSSGTGTVSGVIHQSGGNLTIYNAVYKPGDATAAAFPLLYQTGGTAQIYHPISSRGDQIRVRWSSGTTDTLALPSNRIVG